MTIEELHKIWDKKNKGKAAPTEHDLQASCVRWFRLQYHDYADLLLAIPNGARRTRWERGQVLEEGLRKGTPDLFLAVARGGKHGLWIEMKNGKAGRLSDAQKEMIAKLESQGYACAVCHTMDEFMEIVGEYIFGDDTSVLS